MTTTSVKILSGPEFASRFALRPQLFTWLLGSGASASAGIPTGYMMIRDFKTLLFCRETGLPRREVDSTDPLWIARIDQFFQGRPTIPSSGDPTEYAELFEAVYPTEDERRLYIDAAIRKGTPSFGHRVLASLVAAKSIPCVFTVNFDPLIEIACTQADQLLPAESRAHYTVAALDSAHRAERALRESDWPLIVKLHGDYKSTRLKNTPTELLEQDEKLRRVLSGACQRFGLIVVGYSGRDTSVMEALESTLRSSNPFPGGIFWVTSSEKNLLPSVHRFLERAAQTGVNTFVVLSHTFDEFGADLANQASIPDVLFEHIMASRASQSLRLAPLPIKEARKFPVLRCSALPIVRMPTTARRLTLKIPASTTKVRELLKDAKVRAAVAGSGKELAVFGDDAQLVSALASLGAEVAGTVTLNAEHDSQARGLLYDALIRALCRSRPLIPRLRRAGHAILVAREKEGEDAQRTAARAQRLAKLQEAYDSPLTGFVPELGYPYAEGVRIRLDRCAERWWCVFEPFTFIDFPEKKDTSEEELTSEDGFPLGLRAGDPAGDWRRERWAKRYNGFWTGIIAAWAELLSDGPDECIRAFDVPTAGGIDAEFVLSGITAWSRPSHHHSYFERRR